MNRFTAALTILLQCVGAAVLYGILHDHITARICLEYFTVYHPQLIDSNSPTILALFWGFWATWWVGVLIGLPLSLVSQVGSLPTVSARELRRPTVILLLVMAIGAFLFGLLGYSLANTGMLPIMPDIPTGKHARFYVDAFSHDASYAVGFLGGNVLLGVAWRKRRLKSLPAFARV